MIMEDVIENHSFAKIANFFRIGVAMKKSSTMKRCAARGSRMETEAEMAYNKGRQTVIRMLGTMELISATSNTMHYKMKKSHYRGTHESYCRLSQVIL